MPKTIVFISVAIIALIAIVLILTAKHHSYVKITPNQAYELMQSQNNCTVLDVRTPEEFSQGHIPGAILIPDYELAKRAEKELPDKNALILVYCRSGNRSRQAANTLLKLGYTNVKDFGGIIDWPFETVT